MERVRQRSFAVAQNSLLRDTEFAALRKRIPCRSAAAERNALEKLRKVWAFTSARAGVAFQERKFSLQQGN